MGSTGWYETAYRGYDAALGRFMQVDPLALADYQVSPYVYAGNNPIVFNDPDGLLKRSIAEIVYEANHPASMGYQTFDEAFVYQVWALAEAGARVVNTFQEASGYYEHRVYTDKWGNIVVNDIFHKFFDGSNSNSNVPESSYEQTGAQEIYRDLKKYSGYALSLALPLKQAFERASKYPGTPAPWARTLVMYEKTALGAKIKIPLFEMNALKAGRLAKVAKVGGTVLGLASSAIAVTDMVQNGVTTSNALDLAMGGLAVSGVGTSIAGTYFLLNAASVIFTGKDLGQHIDAASQNLTGKSVTDYINGR